MDKSLKLLEERKNKKKIFLTVIFVLVSILFLAHPFIKHKEIFAEPLIVSCELFKVKKNEALYKYFVGNKVYIYKANIDYNRIRQIRVICQKSNPANAIVFSISGFYFEPENTINIFFYIIFVAFYIVSIQANSEEEDVGEVEEW